MTLSGYFMLKSVFGQQGCRLPLRYLGFPVYYQKTLGNCSSAIIIQLKETVSLMFEQNNS